MCPMRGHTCPRVGHTLSQANGFSTDRSQNINAQNRYTLPITDFAFSCGFDFCPFSRAVSGISRSVLPKAEPSMR